MKTSIKTALVISILPLFAYTQNTQKPAVKQGSKTQNNVAAKTTAKVPATANSIELYDLLVKLIPNEGKLPDMSNLGTSSNLLKWDKPQNVGTNMASINGRSNVTFDGARAVKYNKQQTSLIKCNNDCSEIYVKLNKAGKLYTHFTIESNIDPDDQSFSQWIYADNDSKPNQKLLSRLLGKKDFTATFIPRQENYFSLDYELKLPGKNKVWVSLMLDSRPLGSLGPEIQPIDLMVSVYFNKADLVK